jgi:hypothetical protein
MFSFRRTLAEGCSRIRAMCERLSPLLCEDSEASGLKLLREWLSPEQLAQFSAYGYFDVVGCDTAKRYRIHYGSSMNIDQLDDRGRPRICYCLAMLDPLVPGDVMLAQKIALETEELAVLAVANRFTPKARPSMTSLLSMRT